MLIGKSFLFHFPLEIQSILGRYHGELKKGLPRSSAENCPISKGPCYASNFDVKKESFFIQKMMSLSVPSLAIPKVSAEIYSQDVTYLDPCGRKSLSS